MSTQEASKIDPHSPLAGATVMLAAARDALGAAKAETTRVTAEFNAAHGSKFALVKQAAEQVLALEGTVRSLVVEAFDRTKSKEPLPGLKVKEEETTTFEYDRAEAEKVCREKGLFLVVDWEALEAVAAASPSTVPFVKVTTTKKPKATIATDLSKTVETIKALAAAEPAPVGAGEEA